MKSDFYVRIRYLLIWRWGVIKVQSWLRRWIPLLPLGSSRTNNAHSTRDWTCWEKFPSFLTKLWNKKMGPFVTVQINADVSNFIVSHFFLLKVLTPSNGALVQTRPLHPIFELSKANRALILYIWVGKEYRYLSHLNQTLQNDKEYSVVYRVKIKHRSDISNLLRQLQFEQLMSIYTWRRGKLFFVYNGCFDWVCVKTLSI